MVIDTSAVVAILLREPEADEFTGVLVDALVTLMSAVTRVELSFVAESRKGSIGRRVLEDFLRNFAIEIVPVSLEHAELAIDAFRRFGRGRHPAALNIGDCFSYALARATNQPLLFKGDDYVRTDIAAARLPGA